MNHFQVVHRDQAIEITFRQLSLWIKIIAGFFIGALVLLVVLMAFVIFVLTLADISNINLTRFMLLGMAVLLLVACWVGLPKTLRTVFLSRRVIVSSQGIEESISSWPSRTILADEIEKIYVVAAPYYSRFVGSVFLEVINNHQVQTVDLFGTFGVNEEAESLATNNMRETAKEIASLVGKELSEARSVEISELRDT